MRKFMTLAFVALCLLSISAYASAGDVGDCDSLKKKNVEAPDIFVPGLYGLCVAWYSAGANGDQAAIDAIEAAYDKKSGGGTIPGTDDTDTNPPDPPFECPCWSGLTADYICSLGESIGDSLTPISESLPDVYQGQVYFVTVVDPEPAPPLFESFAVNEALMVCNHQINGVGSTPSLSSLELIDCGFEIGVIADLWYDPDFCPR